MSQTNFCECATMNEQTNQNMYDAIEIVDEAVEISNDNQGIFMPTTDSYRQNSPNAWRIQESAAR